MTLYVFLSVIHNFFIAALIFTYNYGLVVAGGALSQIGTFVCTFLLLQQNFFCLFSFLVLQQLTPEFAMSPETSMIVSQLKFK